MTKDVINGLKKNVNIKFFYKLPCSYWDEGFEYIIVGDSLESDPNTVIYSIEEWLQLMESGSLLPYICGTLPKKYKLKEYLNMYKKPDILALRRYINKLTNVHSIFRESIWGKQLIQENKIYGIDPYKEMEFDPQKAKQEFDIVVDPIYKKYIYDQTIQ